MVGAFRAHPLLRRFSAGCVCNVQLAPSLHKGAHRRCASAAESLGARPRGNERQIMTFDFPKIDDPAERERIESAIVACVRDFYKRGDSPIRCLGRS